ncbi:MAG: tyrosinase family protein [Litorimonas sp.]
MVRVRRNVLNLDAGDRTLHWYSLAVEAMQAIPPTQYDSWWFQANIHGDPDRSTFNPYFSRCQHQSWYFLPWHRGYITAFEAIVADKVARLGGPSDWALPYWDYTEPLSVQPYARYLPEAFRAPTQDGTRNPLFSRRNTPPSGKVGLTDTQVSRAALKEDVFSRAGEGVPPGFGGPPTGFSHAGQVSGELESVPHNVVHVQVGGNMGLVELAARDPIFWLHHANIDRLWEMWHQEPNHDEPTDPAWRSGQRFTLHDGSGAVFHFDCNDMIDTRAVLHGYVYDDLDNVETDEDEMRQTVHQTANKRLALEVFMRDDREPELIGTSDSSLDLLSGAPVATLSLQTGRQRLMTLKSGDFGPPPRAYLNLENIKGSGQPGDFMVYVDVPDDDLEPVPAGLLTTFGLTVASDPASEHGGSGLTRILDITPVAERLGLRDGSDTLQVSFEPLQPERSDAADGYIPHEMELAMETDEMRGAMDEPPSITVGRISLYIE